MTCWAVIPVKATGEAKSRLSGMLDPGERRALVGAMLDHVVAVAKAAPSISAIYLVGPARSGLPADIPLLRDPGMGLNPAVQSALAEIAAIAAAEGGPQRVVFVAADLPGLTAQELDLLAIPPADKIAIAPDRHGTGTNAISLPYPGAENFAFAFGPDSYSKHQLEARRLGFDIETILSPGLERDIDEPADIVDAQAIIEDGG